MSFEGKSPLNKCINFNGLSRQETILQLFPMNIYNDWPLSLFYLQPIFSNQWLLAILREKFISGMSCSLYRAFFMQKPSSTHSNSTCGVFIYTLNFAEKAKNLLFYDKYNSLHSCFLLPFLDQAWHTVQINPPVLIAQLMMQCHRNPFGVTVQKALEWYDVVNTCLKGIRGNIA